MKIQDAEQCPCRSGLRFGECHGKRIKERQAAMRHYRMTVIPESQAGSRDVLHLFTAHAEGTDFGGGMDILDCGSCGSPLMIGVDRNMMKRLPIRCLTCLAVNET
jgi:hypothetical protein